MRALRRHHRERIKAKRNNIPYFKDQSERGKGIMVDTPKPCSCFMCGNPRKYFNQPTIQEQKAYSQFAYQEL